MIQDRRIRKNCNTHYTLHTPTRSTQRRDKESTILQTPHPQSEKGNESTNSRSSSSQHLMPLRLRTHTQRRGKKQRKSHNQTNLQRALSRHQKQHRRRADQERDGREHEEETHDYVDAAFAAEVEVVGVCALALFGGGEDLLERV